ncbi:MAG: hypothetical protein GY947_06540 [Rhodobacteraceae bacterium]|nr:hypothetical protein [Paracoccaceae bacterium]
MADVCAALITSAENEAEDVCRLGGKMSPEQTLSGRAVNKILGLEADLEIAVEIAFASGAEGWLKSNYPDLFERFSRISSVH